MSRRPRQVSERSSGQIGLWMPNVFSGFGQRAAIVVALLAAFFLTGCHKADSQQKPSPKATASSGQTNLLSRDLGTLTLTDNREITVPLASSNVCLIESKMVDKRTVQLTLTLESKTAQGKVHDFCMTQVIAPVGKPLETAVGDYTLSFTPNVISK